MATSSSYTLAEDDIGQQISVTITSSVETGTVTSAATAAVQKADCATVTGITPLLSEKTDTTVTLTAVAGYEYTVVANDADISTGIWQASNAFSGLTNTTDYDFYQRVKETTTHKASEVSEKLDVTTFGPPLTGTALITGTAVYGETLSASLNGTNNTGTLSYQWLRGGSNIALATSSSYTLAEDDIGQQISVTITSSVETGTVTSAATAAVQKADCATATGIAPVLSGKTDTTVTLTAVAGYEYIVVANDADVSTGIWQDSNVFSGLTNTTNYDFYQRVKETTTHKASGVSEKLDVTTDNPSLTGTALITGTAVYGETLNASLNGTNNTGTLSYQWLRGGSNIALATSSSYTLAEDDIGQQISVTITSSAETGTVTSAATAAVQKAECPTVTGIAPALSGKTDTTVTLTAVAGYEYTVVTNDADVSTGIWQDSNVFSGLTNTTDYDFYQRVKETTTHKASGVSEKLDVITDNPSLTGTALITGTAVYGETLSASLNGTNNTGTLSYQWLRGGSNIALATSSSYTLAEEDIGQQISVTITSSAETGTVTSAATAAVQKADCATATGIAPVLSGKTDSTVTLTAVAGYEYIVVANGADVSTGIWQDSNVFSGLTGSTDYDFYQRIKETTTHKASGVSEKLDVTTDVAVLSDKDAGSIYVLNQFIVGEDMRVTVDLTGGSSILSAAQMDKLIKFNQDYPVVMSGDGYSITFPKGSLTLVGGHREYDLGIHFNMGSDYTIIRSLSGDDFLLMLNFNHSGALPGEAQISLYVGRQCAGDTLYYYYYNPQNRNLEYMQTAMVDADGYINVTQTHCSSYVLTLYDPYVLDNIPKTGDNGPNIPGWVLCCASVAGFLTLLILRKRENT